MKESLRSADMHLPLLGRHFAYAKDNEYIIRNALERVERLHEGTRRDIVWSDEQLDKILNHTVPHIARVAKIAL